MRLGFVTAAQSETVTLPYGRIVTTGGGGLPADTGSSGGGDLAEQAMEWLKAHKTAVYIAAAGLFALALVKRR